MASGSMPALPRPSAEVHIRRYHDMPDCDVVVSVRGQRLIVTCPNYDQAVSWAKVECKSYRIPPVVGHSWFTVTPAGAVMDTPAPAAER